jgi:hypothetical protein
VISLRLRDDNLDLDALIDELVEAHMDTIEMLGDWLDDPSWHSHSVYLQGLVRHTKRVTARRV